MLRNFYFYYVMTAHRSFKFILAILLVAVCNAYGGPTLNEFLRTTNASPELKEQAYRMTRSLIAEDHPADQRTLGKLFRKIHSRFLKKYVALSDFDQLFTKGKYDCLTATALFSYVLEEMGYDFKLMETNYHIFIMVQTKEGMVLLETTDRLGGFITDPTTIRSRTGEYSKNWLVSKKEDRILYDYSFKLYQEITPDRLTGLLIYNQAVKAYNHGDLQSCARLLERAYDLYSSVRCEALGDILTQTLMERKVSEEVRATCMAHLKSILMRREGTLAAN
jgi:hypothetical protein